MGGFSRINQQARQQLPKPINPPPGQIPGQSTAQPGNTGNSMQGPIVSAPPVANKFEFKQPPYPSANVASGLIAPPGQDPAAGKDPRFLGPPITAPPVNDVKNQLSVNTPPPPINQLTEQLPNQPMFDPSLIKAPQLDYRRDTGNIMPPYNERGGFTGNIMPSIMDNRVEQASPPLQEGPAPFDQRDNQRNDQDPEENMRRRFGGRNRFNEEQ
jgi:hypothetical protein